MPLSSSKALSPATSLVLETYVLTILKILQVAPYLFPLCVVFLLSLQPQSKRRAEHSPPPGRLRDRSGAETWFMTLVFNQLVKVVSLESVY